MVARSINCRSYVRGRLQVPVDYIQVDLGTGGLRMGCSNEGDENCREIGNYPEAQAGTPSLVSQAPSDIIYQPSDDGPAEAVAFGHVRPRVKRGQTAVSKVKIALLPNPTSYGYAHSLLVAASETLKLHSVQQIPEDFLRLAIEHAIKECGGQPRKGWVFSVPQSYSIDQGRMFRDMIQRVGCKGGIYIQNESDCVAYANLPLIEDIVDEERNICFKRGLDFTIAAAVVDLGAGTAVSTHLLLQ